MTKVLEAGSCLADLTSSSSVPQDCTRRIYLYFTKLYESPRTFMWNGEVASSAASSKLETLFRPGKACSQLVLERRVKYDDHARWRVKNSRWCYWIATSMLRKTRCSIIILVSISVVCNNFDTGNFNWIMCIKVVYNKNLYYFVIFRTLILSVFSGVFHWEPFSLQRRIFWFYVSSMHI